MFRAEAGGELCWRNTDRYLCARVFGGLCVLLVMPLILSGVGHNMDVQCA